MNTEVKSSTFLPRASSQATSALVSSISTAGPSSPTISPESSFTTSTTTTFTSSPTITNASHLTSLSSHPAPALQASTAPFGFTVSTSFVTPTESVILQSASANSSHQGLKTIQVIAIVTSASVFLLALLAVASYLFIRRRRQRRFPPSKGPKLDDEIIEKYGTEAQYTAYLGYKQGTAESRGTTPLIDTHIDRSPIHSPSDIEHGRFDIPSSPFVNGDDDASRIPIRHAISLANATPLVQPLESPLDFATFIPNSAPSSARMKSPVPLAPIAIPEYAPPTRRNTKGRRSARRSKGPYMSLETGEESDGDSASMYSQASASAATIQSVSTHLELSDSTIRTFPLTAIQHLPSHEPHAMTAQRDETIVSKPMAPYAAIFTPASHPAIKASADQTQEEEDADAARVAQENAVLVANLLKSRAMQVKQPERSSSIVSHIERAGSIKPAFLAIEEGGSSTRPSRRGVRAARKSRSGSPAQAVHASQDGVNGA